MLLNWNNITTYALQLGKDAKISNISKKKENKRDEKYILTNDAGPLREFFSPGPILDKIKKKEKIGEDFC